jgi:hypothetical protein
MAWFPIGNGHQSIISGFVGFIAKLIYSIVPYMGNMCRKKTAYRKAIEMQKQRSVEVVGCINE